MLYAASHRRSTVLRRQTSSRLGARPSTPTQRPRSASAPASSELRPSSAAPSQHTPQKAAAIASPTQRRRISLQRLNPISGLRRRMQLAFSRDHPPEEPRAAPKAKKKATNPKDVVLAERERVNEIKELIDAEQYDAALRNLLSDSAGDLHYFNQIKSGALGEKHQEAFARRHGKLMDFQERPAPVEEQKTCLWSGANDGPLRCHNKCLYHPVETVRDQLGAEHPKQLDFCVYHVKYCVNTDNHLIPVTIKTPNDEALCNECFVLKNGEKPKELMRIPGTRRVRKLG